MEDNLRIDIVALHALARRERSRLMAHLLRRAAHAIGMRARAELARLRYSPAPSKGPT